ncbi:hypothetical protein HN695_02765 [Candidatus Woesearchaeota archaeon]|jgi:hypothetical protein|nr:hypothetical protein [Candidatus Woesearchaeota archaeon]MBT5272113.1 hypothetical protein [Candidatus Woesearchaeota archaeon]MBT6040916.1 hypothetical protein [Candidatus Woesearchaeota archaeon]MBT6336250.1 hypothetical protein [Candidatus Woesearchaeota archaeon]MBT7927233.1 hypothetical protein [Candidatus Woesearchaeota archaeon]
MTDIAEERTENTTEIELLEDILTKPDVMRRLASHERSLKWTGKARLKLTGKYETFREIVAYAINKDLSPIHLMDFGDVLVETLVATNKEDLELYQNAVIELLDNCEDLGKTNIYVIPIAKSLKHVREELKESFLDIAVAYVTSPGGANWTNIKKFANSMNLSVYSSDAEFFTEIITSLFGTDKSLVPRLFYDIAEITQEINTFNPALAGYFTKAIGLEIKRTRHEVKYENSKPDDRSETCQVLSPRGCYFFSDCYDEENLRILGREIDGFESPEVADTFFDICDLFINVYNDLPYHNFKCEHEVYETLGNALNQIEESEASLDEFYSRITKFITTDGTPQILIEQLMMPLARIMTEAPEKTDKFEERVKNIGMDYIGKLGKIADEVIKEYNTEEYRN